MTRRGLFGIIAGLIAGRKLAPAMATGGYSNLLPCPAPDLTLEVLQKVYVELLVNSMPLASPCVMRSAAPTWIAPRAQAVILRAWPNKYSSSKS
jgi:hypothetical protein